MHTRPDTRRPSRATALRAALFAAMLASSCGSDPTATGTADGSSRAPEEFGLTVAQLDARIESTEQLMAACMSELGFQYIPIDPTTLRAAMASDKSAPGVSSDDYLAKYGLGITTQFDKPLIVFGAGPENNEYLNGLPAADQVAFRRALWGEAPDINHARALEEEDFSGAGGCTRSSAEQVYSPNELSGSYINPTDKLVAQDPRMVAALGKWSECMRQDALEYATPDDVDADLIERFGALTRGQDPSTLTGAAMEQLQALQDEERAIAASLNACEERFVEPVQEQVETELYGSTN